MSEYITTIGMVVHTCDCGLTWAVSKVWNDARKEDHKTFYCPNGCSRHYPAENEEEKLRRKLMEKEKCCIAAQEDAERAHEETVKERARFYGLKGHVAKLKRQAAK